jgi:hypothetical protein
MIIGNKTYQLGLEQEIFAAKIVQNTPGKSLFLRHSASPAIVKKGNNWLCSRFISRTLK